MPTFYATTTAITPVSTAAAAYAMQDTAPGATTLLGPADNTIDFGPSTSIDIAWEWTITAGNVGDGSQTWAADLDVTALGGTVTGRFRLSRYSSAGTLLSSSAYSAEFTTTGIKSLSTTWDPGTWATGDRLVLEVQYYRSGGHGNVDMTFGIGSADTLITAPAGAGSVFDETGRDAGTADVTVDSTDTYTPGGTNFDETGRDAGTAAVTVDATDTYTPAGGTQTPSHVSSSPFKGVSTDTLSGPFDAGTATDRVLFVAVMHGNFGALTHNAPTYNGVTLTQVQALTDVGSENRRISVWKLEDPASGSNTLSVTISGVASQISALAWVADKANSTGQVALATGAGTDIGVDITPGAATSRIYSMVMASTGSGDPFTPDATHVEHTDDGQGNHSWTLLSEAPGSTSLLHMGTTSSDAGASWAAIAIEVTGVSGATTYDETGRDAGTAAITVDETDTQNHDEITDAGTAAVTVDATDAQTYVEATDAGTAAITVDETDARTLVEVTEAGTTDVTTDATDLQDHLESTDVGTAAVTVDETDALTHSDDTEVSVAFDVTETDLQDHIETVTETIAVTVDETDSFSGAFDETGRDAGTAAITVDETDAQTHFEDLTETLAVTVDATDAQDHIEAPTETILVTVDETDLQDHLEALTETIDVTTEATDIQVHSEVLDVTLDVTTTVQDEQSGAFNETGREATLDVTTEATDVSAQVETGREATLDVTTEATDQLSGAFDETGREVSLAVTVDETDLQAHLEGPSITIPVTVDSTSVQDHIETVEVTASVTTEASDSLTGTWSEEVTVEITFEVAFGVFMEDLEILIPFTTEATDLGSGAVVIKPQPVLVHTQALGSLEKRSISLSVAPVLTRITTLVGGAFIHETAQLEITDAGQISISVAATDDVRQTPIENVSTSFAVTTEATDESVDKENPEVPIFVTVEATDEIQGVGATEVTFGVTVSATDLTDNTESGQTTIDFSVSRTDTQRMREWNRLVDIPVTVEATDVYLPGVSPEIVFAVSVTATDIQDHIEAPEITVPISVTQFDLLRSDITENTNTDLVVTPTANSTQRSRERVEIQLAVTTEVTDDFVGGEASQVIGSITTEATDVLAATDVMDTSLEITTSVVTIQSIPEFPEVSISIEPSVVTVGRFKERDRQVEVTFTPDVATIQRHSEAPDTPISIEVDATSPQTMAGDTEAVLTLSTTSTSQAVFVDAPGVAFEVTVTHSATAVRRDNPVVAIQFTPDVTTVWDATFAAKTSMAITVDAVTQLYAIEDLSVTATFSAEVGEDDHNEFYVPVLDDVLPRPHLMDVSSEYAPRLTDVVGHKAVLYDVIEED